MRNCSSQVQTKRPKNLLTHVFHTGFGVLENIWFREVGEGVRAARIGNIQRIILPETPR